MAHESARSELLPELSTVSTVGSAAERTCSSNYLLGF